MPFYIFGRFGEGRAWSHIAPAFADTDYVRAVEAQANLARIALALGRTDMSFKVCTATTQGEAEGMLQAQTNQTVPRSVTRPRGRYSPRAAWRAERP